MYYFFFLASRIVPHLPFWLLRLLPSIIGPLAWLIGRPARKQATINALHVLGTEVQSTSAGRRRLRRVVRGMFRYSARNRIEAFLMPSLPHQEVRRRLYAANEECIKEALKLGKGAILCSAHFGPFEYYSQWFADHGYQVVIPVEKLKNERLLRLVLSLRNSAGATYIPLGGTTAIRRMIQSLRNNQLVLITADRAVEGESIVRDFFGAPARLPIGPVNLSLRTGAPLIGALGWYSSRNHISGEFFPLTLALPEEERQQPEALEDALVKGLERVIGAHPEQWVVFSRVWEEQEITASAKKVR